MNLRPSHSRIAMDFEDISQWLSTRNPTATPLVTLFSKYLTAQEAAQIFQQFQSNNWIYNGQVLWSGVPRDKAQEWAGKHHLQTLTTAMGPLMDEDHPKCLKSKKSSHQWSQYVHGASAIFAWHIARGEKVTVLSPPPPERFHPSGLTYYQAIEKPIIQGQLGRCAVHRIILVHPTVTESEEFLYEIWPVDKSSTWIQKFGLRNTKRKWREIGRSGDNLRLKTFVASPKQHFLPLEQRECDGKIKVRRENSSLSTGPHHITQVGPDQLVPIIMLATFFFLVTTRFALFILMSLSYTLIDKALHGNEVNRYCRLQENRTKSGNKMAHLEPNSAQTAKADQKAESKAQQEAKRTKLKSERKAQAKAQEMLKGKRKPGRKKMRRESSN